MLRQSIPFCAFVILLTSIGVAADELTKAPAKPVAPVAKDTAPQPTFSGDRAVIVLPGPIDDFTFGAGGRFVIGHLRGQRRLAIVDVLEAKVVKVLDLPPGGIAMAAGRDKLMIAEKEAGMVSRWSLKTFEKEASTASPVEGPIRAIAMGSDSTGPLIISGEKKSALMIPNTMKFETFSWNPPADHIHPAMLAAAADGRSVVGYGDPMSDSVVMLTLGVDKVLDRRSSQAIRSPIALMPAADGSCVFEAGIKPAKRWRGDLSKPQILSFAMPNVAPSLDPSLFTAWEISKDAKPQAAVYSCWDPRPLLAVDGLEELAEPSDLQASARLELNPKSNVLVSFSGALDKVIVRKFDLIKALDAKGADYLFVTSSPPTSAVKGRPFVYPVTVKSKRGGMKYSFDESPKGMTVSPAGLVRWQIPVASTETQAMVTVKVVDASEQTLFQEFVIALTDPPKKPTQTAAGKPAKPDNRGFMDRALGPIDKIRK